jgi:seryl-tRNA synthetase
LKTRSKELDETLKSIESELYEVLVTLPNLPHNSVPEGKTPEENEVILENGTIPTLTEDALAHWDLICADDIIDFELGNKITGAGFPVYKGKGARIQRALINFFLGRSYCCWLRRSTTSYLD